MVRAVRIPFDYPAWFGVFGRTASETCGQRQADNPKSEPNTTQTAGCSRWGHVMEP